MEYVYAARNAEEFERYKSFSERIGKVIDKFVDHLKTAYGVFDLPRCIVFADEVTATRLISDVPVPAYTNDFRIVFTPDLEVWRRIYLSQTKDETVTNYYNTKLNERHLLQIIGHEIAHHIDMFSDEAYENGGAWFEEGAVEYISRKYFLSDAEFEECAENDKRLVALFESSRSPRPLGVFGGTDDFATIFYDYARAFHIISEAVRRHGDIKSVIQKFADCPDASIPSAR